MQQARRYEFHELLGRGGMGEVYRGTAVGVHGFTKQVAIKRLVRELASSRQFVERLVDEAKLLSALQHSNLVSVLDLGRSTDDVFIALEYVDGPDLGTLLKACKQLPLGTACFVIRSACEGLAFAHQRPQPVIHADLSPSNILLSRAGEVKVTDFGIARVGGRRQPSGVEGKWPYMAPEQARGEPLTPLSDVFSMGIVLYQIMVGQRPFRGDSVEALRDAIYEAEPPAPREFRDDIPDPLQWLCLRALHKDPGERFESIRALGKALAEVAFSQGWRDGPAELAELIAKRCPPSLASRSSRSIMLADLGVGAANETRQTTPEWPAGRPRIDSTPAELTGTVVAPTSGALDGLTRWTVRPPAVVGRRRWPLMAAVAIIVASAAGLGAFFLLQKRLPETPATNTNRPTVSLNKPDASRANAFDQAARRRQPPRDVVAPLPDDASARDIPEPASEQDVLRRRRRRTRGQGMLRLHAEPWGYVKINGRKTGKSTPSVHRVRAGRCRVQIDSPSTGLSRTLVIRIKAGQTITRSVKLRRQR